MYEILKKTKLNPAVTLMVINAPLVARKAEPGQFIILRVNAKGERIPLTIADFDRELGTVTIIFQIVGATTELLNHMKVGECLCDFVGPLGKPTDIQKLHRVIIIGGGVGSAIAYPIAKKFYENKTSVHSILGFRNKDFIILEKEFEQISDKLIVMTDDGSNGNKGLVTNALNALIEEGEFYNEVITIGPLVMMKFVSMITEKYKIKTIASMNPIMIDGTGMCGGCRLTVDGKTKFACVDGPDFDAHFVDFDELIKRSTMYQPQEKIAHKKTCNLFKEAGTNVR